MYNIKLRCPSCYNETGFFITALDSYQVEPGKPIRDKAVEIVKAWAIGKCPNCGQVVLAQIKTTLEGYEAIKRSLSDFQFVPTLTYLEVLTYYPEPPKPYTHEALPPKVNALYKDLQEILWLKKNPSLIVAGCRSVLEEAIKALGAEGKTLKEKIEDLYRKGVITFILKDWADQIRLQGNEAIHELEATPEEAEEMVEFVRIFLIYTFELPYRIKKIRNL